MKVGDALKNVLDGDEAQMEKMKNVNDSMFSVSWMMGSWVDVGRTGRSVLADVFLE